MKLTKPRGVVIFAASMGLLALVLVGYLLWPLWVAPYYKTTSHNWGGRVVFSINGNVNSVSGSWVEPAVSNCGNNEITVIWIGIDGWISGSVEQLGTELSCSNGTIIHSAWFESYPYQGLQDTNLTIRGGDKITASVVYNGDGKFIYHLIDETNGANFTKIANGLNEERASAEWIVERPSISFPSFGAPPDYAPLLPWRTVNFENMNYTSTGWLWMRNINMVDINGTLLAKTSGNGNTIQISQ